MIFLFIFLYALLFFGVPDITDTNYPFHKLVLFLLLFGYTYITTIIDVIRERKTIDQIMPLDRALKVGLIGVIGYSLFVDWINMDDLMFDSRYSLYLMATSVMVGSITVMKIAYLLFV